MNIWTAFIIINVTANPLVLDTKPHGPFEFEVQPDKNLGPQPQPQFKMEGTAGKDWTIGSMIGVQANTAVSTPTSATFDFEDEAACNKARDMLVKQFGVASVSCIQVQRR